MAVERVDQGGDRAKAGPGGPLRRGWTTGACATAATKAALCALLTGHFPDPVEILLPKGERPAFALNRQRLGEGSAMAAIIKDAGDDPDVTHLAEIVSTVRLLPAGSGLVFRAGPGVGMVTMPGLPIPPGEPAINPVPRALMRGVVEALAAEHGTGGDVEIEISVSGGEALAQKTWNPRLGIVGGLSILGTTGIVHPFSCSAWIHSIHRGIDVAKAAGLAHVVGSTGSTSEDAARRRFPDLPEIAYLDMGDFAGGLIKYLRLHPVPRVTIAGGFAKLVKLSQGAMDLHSGRSQVDFAFLADLAASIDPGRGAALRDSLLSANTAKAALDLSAAAGLDLGRGVAEAARAQVQDMLRGAPVAAEVLVVDRAGEVVGHAG
ncbi:MULTISPECIES: cobalt-precorrin-5B (C(1))-methyltransferase [unclassified Aureimonas]|uniref:cobalt-precorrin-5B (C(1))-methyltransferase n=1 Tax=unclassified Aureimonas TaxID=2615206 RepID=UPI0006F42E8C|nr:MULTISPECIES: cobalt-precorrin-5B (C(1))-methyltransferase [unclassified Aureimonas]KQT64111.1 cobalt-precorrin-6A synthase [Aureimonas sp. Leaf427]KQT81300.1 cobalt-precorrin-6A synthase [Aureimonas sp. Leaf460]